jgi:16S rRNA (guanine527-N7)-methyltransferase
MYAHYQELRRWNRRMALVGAGLVDRVVERMFGESLAALPLLGRLDESIVDVGSGAGFPGLVIAAARPDARVTLVEPRQKKWAFLRSAADRCALSCVCLNARVAAALPSCIPESIDRVTVRALRLEPEQIRSLASRLTPEGSFLIWASGELELPSGFRESRAVSLGEGRGRIQEVLAPRRSRGS